MSREAMQLALEALVFAQYEDEYYDAACDQKVREARDALRQALETEQEPVAFINAEKQKLEWAKLTSWHTPTIVNLPKIPLYTAPPKRDLTCVCGAVWEGEMMVHPPRKREWVGLTDEEIDYQAKKDDHAVYFALGALWAEAKLKEKNNA